MIASEARIIENIRRVSTAFVGNARSDLQRRWAALPRDLEHRELHEVVGGLLSRQVTLAAQLAMAPTSWNGHVGPLFLRAMAEVHITLVWIFKEPTTRARDFVLHGLSEEKLRIEHRREDQTAVAAANPEEYEGMLAAMEAWVEEQRVLHLVEVNLGSWSGKSTRAMAEEAGCLDFYNYVFAPFSTCVHSMWNHVARYDLVQCDNPLHQYHRVARSTDRPLDLDYLRLVARYLDKSQRQFDRHFGLEITEASALEKLETDLEEVAAKLEETDEASG